jgi:hypothetical protein
MPDLPTVPLSLRLSPGSTSYSEVLSMLKWFLTGFHGATKLVDVDPVLAVDACLGQLSRTDRRQLSVLSDLIDEI